MGSAGGLVDEVTAAVLDVVECEEGLSREDPGRLSLVGGTVK